MTDHLPIERKKSMNYAINWMFLLYFLILFAERAQSLVRSAKDGFGSLFATPFSGYVNLLAALSLAATVVFLLARERSFFPALFTGAAADYAGLSVAAGILLLSGMVHTEYTIAPVQFGAYGALIIAMILETVKNSGSAARPVSLWLSLFYLIAFSMAIPVMYRSALPHAAVFHIVEAIVSAALVVLFTLMLRAVFTGEAEFLFTWVPILVAAVGDTFLIWFRWKEQVNWFVLIALSLAVVLFAAGRIVTAVSR